MAEIYSVLARIIIIGAIAMGVLIALNIVQNDSLA